MAGPEKRFENQVKNFLNEKGCWYVKYFANSFTKSGVPDILACIGGYFVAIEVKASNGKPSKLQRHHQSMIRKSGGFSIVLYPEDFNDFKKLVLEMLKNRPDRTWPVQYSFDLRYKKYE